MSKGKHANAGIGPDNWLYIASHALSLYAEEGGAIVVRDSPAGLVIELPLVVATDSRLHEELRVRAAEPAAPGGPQWQSL